MFSIAFPFEVVKSHDCVVKELQKKEDFVQTFFRASCSSRCFSSSSLWSRLVVFKDSFSCKQVLENVAEKGKEKPLLVLYIDCYGRPLFMHGFIPI